MIDLRSYLRLTPLRFNVIALSDGLSSDLEINGNCSLSAKHDRETGGKRGRHKSAQTRDMILAAAARSFRSKGYSATKLKEIAAAAGIEAGSLYYYFSSKEELLDDVLDIGCRSVIKAVGNARAGSGASGGSFRETFGAMVYEHLNYILQADDFTAANMRNFSMLPPPIRARHRRGFDEYGKIWFDFLTKARDNGDLRSDMDIRTLRRVIFGALNWSVEWFNTEQFSVGEYAEKATSLMLDGMLIPTHRWKGQIASGVHVEPMSAELAGKSKAAQTRLHILISASRVLREKGYEGITLRHIAEVAGIEAGSIYYHFASKDEIIDEVLTGGLREITSGVTEVLENETDYPETIERIAAGVRAHMLYLYARNDFVTMNIRIYGQLPQEVRQRHRPIRQQYVGIWSRILKQGQATGKIHTDLDIVPARQLMLGALNWTTNWFNPEFNSMYESKSLEDLINLILILFMDGLDGRREDR